MSNLSLTFIDLSRFSSFIFKCADPPDLAPCEFQLFSKLKIALKGHVIPLLKGIPEKSLNNISSNSITGGVSILKVTATNSELHLHRTIPGIVTLCMYVCVFIKNANQ